MSGAALDAFALAGRNDHPHYASGWHGRERDGRTGIAYRAVDGTGVIRLRRAPGAQWLECLVSGPRGLATEALIGSWSIDGGADESLALDSDIWVTRRLAIPRDATELVVRFEMRNAPVPDAVLRNGDARRLGWFVSAVWQSAKA